MELKKSPKANLEKLRLIFREVGLALVLIIAILAFEWGAPKLSLEQIPPRWEVIDVDYIPITQPDKPQVARIEHKLPALSDVIVPVESGTLDVKPFDELFVDLIDNVSERDYIFIPPVSEDEPLPPEVIEVPPTFQGGGVEGFRKWVSKNIQYPELATIKWG
jgi:protein TonB